MSGLRRRLLIAGLVLLAMASAYAIGTRELALPKTAPSAAAPAVGQMPRHTKEQTALLEAALGAPSAVKAKAV